MTYPSLYKHGGNFETIKNNILSDILFGNGNGFMIKNKTIISIYDDKLVELKNWDEFEKKLSSNSNVEFIQFIKDYGLIYKITKSNLSQDWISNFVNVTKIALENYSKNMNKFKTYKEYDETYYEIIRLNREFQSYFNEGGIKQLNRIQDLWGYKKTNSVPTIEDCKILLQEEWIIHYQESIKFLYKFIQKFS